MNSPLAMPLPDDDLLPQRLGVEVGVVGLGADGGGVDQHLRAAEGVDPRQLREPLVPAGGHAQPCAAEFGGGVDLVGIVAGGPWRKNLSS